MDSVKHKGPVFQKIFEFCYKYKLKWCQNGTNTPIMDFLVFNKVRIYNCHKHKHPKVSLYEAIFFTTKIMSTFNFQSFLADTSFTWWENELDYCWRCPIVS